MTAAGRIAERGGIIYAEIEEEQAMELPLGLTREVFDRARKLLFEYGFADWGYEGDDKITNVDLVVNLHQVFCGGAASITPKQRVEITQKMINAGVDVLTAEFGMPTENPLVDFPALARRVYLQMWIVS